MNTPAPLWQRMGLPAPDVPSPGPWTGDDKGNVRDAEGRLVAQLMRHADMGAVLALPELIALLAESRESIGGDWRARRDAVLAKIGGSQP